MVHFRKNGSPLPPALGRDADAARNGRLDRREFLALATSFGATAATGYAMLGMPAPAHAQGAPRQGGQVRLQSQLVALRDPRRFDFNQIATFTSGWLEYLLKYNSDGTFSPRLLEGWSISDDARTYVLNVRRGVQWNDGTPFTAADVARNIEGWADGSFEGNAMKSKVAVIVDPATDRALAGAIEIVDDHTVRLNLPRPDISLIAGFSDYPAAIVPAGFDDATMLSKPVGTGPYLPESYDVGVGGALVRNPSHRWWNEGNGAWLDRIEFIDLGADPAAHFASADADEIDATFDSQGDYIALFDQLPGWTRNQAVTAATILARANQQAEVDGTRPYADARVRRALAMAVDNAAVLDIAAGGFGTPAENHHVSPVHPDYAELPPPAHDPAGARALMAEAGMAAYEHELVSLDAGFWASAADAIAGQLRAAGIPVRRTVYPGGTFWNNWAKYPFSVTNWNHRPLGI
jgi:peptide/nickel transport system substrate-binding protein